MKALSKYFYVPELTCRPLNGSSGLRMLASALLMLGSTPAAHAVCYVNAAATGHNDGTSWADASTQLQFALINPLCTEIWVAKGVYKPTLSSDRTISFDVFPGTQLFGGFTGGETTRDARNPKANVTVLSGDIDDNDVNHLGTEIDETANDIRGQNTFHLINMDGTRGTPITASTVLDGFVVTGGDASDADNFAGGGLYCDGSGLFGRGHSCNPLLRDLIFSGNRARGGAAIDNNGISLGESSPTLIRVVFRGNATGADGGAIFNDGSFGLSSPTLIDVVFEGNSAQDGGAMMNWGPDSGTSNPILKNVSFINNHAQINGGAVANYGFDVGNSSPTFINVTFVGNTADQNGGAIHNLSSSPDPEGVSSPVFTNVTFAGNHAGGQGGAIFNEGTSSLHNNPVLTNVILWNDSASLGYPEIANGATTSRIRNSVIQGGCPTGSSICLNISAADPVLAPLGNYGGFSRTMRPDASSSAIDAADDAECPNSDQRGVARPQGTHCDIGAVEWRLADDIIFKDSFEPILVP